MPVLSNFFLLIEFGNDIFITYEMPMSSFLMSFWKINISLLFRPSVIRGPWSRLCELYRTQIRLKKKTFTRKGRFMFTSRKLVKVIAIAYYYSHWSKKVPHSEERAEIKMLFTFYSMLINFFFAYLILIKLYLCRKALFPTIDCT